MWDSKHIVLTGQWELRLSFHGLVLLLYLGRGFGDLEANPAASLPLHLEEEEHEEDIREVSQWS